MNESEVALKGIKSLRRRGTQDQGEGKAHAVEIAKSWAGRMKEFLMYKEKEPLN